MASFKHQMLQGSLLIQKGVQIAVALESWRCNLAYGCECLRETCCLHLEGKPWRWSQQVCLNSWYWHTRLTVSQPNINIWAILGNPKDWQKVRERVTLLGYQELKPSTRTLPPTDTHRDMRRGKKDIIVITILYKGFKLKYIAVVNITYVCNQLYAVSDVWLP